MASGQARYENPGEFPRGLLRYRGAPSLIQGLPTTVEPWVPGGRNAQARGGSSPAVVSRLLRRAVSHRPWRWPERPVYFISDPHADAEAFVGSLVASGGVKQTGAGLDEITLTKRGRKGTFVIGGDCLDKGPSNLTLLRSLRRLMDSGARVTLLAGNHDMRLLMGLMALEHARSPRTEHLFVRMGNKAISLFKEVYAEYLEGQAAPLAGVPGRKGCRRRLFPGDDWFEAFPEMARGRLSDRAIDKELTRLRKKVASFESSCEKAGLTLRQVYAAAMRLRELFLRPEGEFAWFFEAMQLAHRDGSFLFVHAGLDDSIAALIESEGIEALNQRFAELVVEDPFAFYYGPLANTLRTKYRKVDFPLTERGVDGAYREGIHAVVHGHINLTAGQRLMIRRGMLHIEGDITLDRNSRRKEGLAGHGMGVTIIHPTGRVIGISNDYPHAKVFEPAGYLAGHRAPGRSASKHKAGRS
ncbi:metallophosphoesterase [Halomonas sp. THAF12]|uniref:metallophosphoesterase n=1 Tax=Halomonas sp. B23F22_10 TaxID=3459515 RepID=UPI00373E04AC